MNGEDRKKDKIKNTKINNENNVYFLLRNEQKTKTQCALRMLN